MNEFGSFIRQKREAMGLTLVEVSGKIGINHSHLSRVEKGERNPPKAPTLHKLARVLCIPVAEMNEKAGYFDKLVEHETQEINDLTYRGEEIIEDDTTDNNIGRAVSIFEAFSLMDKGYVVFHNDWYYKKNDNGKLCESFDKDDTNDWKETNEFEFGSLSTMPWIVVRK